MDYIKYLRGLVGHNKVIMVTAGVFIFDQSERLLLHQRPENRLWAHPGGFMELEEKVEDTARREAFEETGLTLGKLEFFGIYSGDEQENVLENGDQVAGVNIMFSCREFEGALAESNEESLNLQFFPLNNLPKLWDAQKSEFDDLLTDGVKTIY